MHLVTLEVYEGDEQVYRGSKTANKRGDIAFLPRFPFPINRYCVLI